jgi:hypothetical protein
MNFTILGPSEGNLSENKSDMTDARFGGQRKVVSKSVGDAKDYTKRTGTAPNRKENPVDETVRDVDDMSDVNDNFADPTTERAKKREFSRREETSNVQKSNEANWQVKSDPDNRPRMDEGSDAVQVPEVVEERVRKKANRWHYESSDTYEGEIS